MAGPLETALRSMFVAFDKKDYAVTLKSFTGDAQGIDEISRKWIRGGAGIADYFKQIGPVTEGMKTEIKDVSEKVWGDAGFVTCWIHQDYKYQGKQDHVASPTTAVFRREGGTWKIALFHAIPLPEA